MAIERDQAFAILGRWRELPSATPAQETESHLWRALTVLIPDDCVAAAMAVEGEPRVVALTERTLVEIATIDSPAGVRAKSRAVDPATASVELVETVAQTGGPIGGLARIRKWAFQLGGNVTYSWETRQVLTGGFLDEKAVSAEEHLARHLAAAAGWVMPTRDIDGPDWEWE